MGNKKVHIDLSIDQDDVKTMTLERENYICFICFLPDNDGTKEVHIDLSIDQDDVKTMTLERENYICFICFLPDNDGTDKQQEKRILVS